MEMKITTEELQRKLRKLSEGTSEALLLAMTKAALNIEGRAKELCPVITGTLRRSISSKAERKADKAIGTVGANVEYAAAVEFGTSKRPPKPYIMPAIKEKQDETMDILGDAIKSEIRRHT